jgi:hypothetical protein
MNIVIIVDVIIIIIIMVTGETANSEPQPFLDDSTRLRPVFNSLNFTTNFFCRVRSSALYPTLLPNLEGTGLYVPSDTAAQF